MSVGLRSVDDVTTDPGPEVFRCWCEMCVLGHDFGLCACRLDELAAPPGADRLRYLVERAARIDREILRLRAEARTEYEMGVRRRLRELGLTENREGVAACIPKGTETEAEERVARKLGEPRAVLSHVYAWLWGCSLSAERDDRVAAQLPVDAPRRTVQAVRGLVTRGLVGEVRDYIEWREELVRRGPQ